MRQKDDVACIVYSSGTGGRPKGCVLTHENYLEQCHALTAWYPFWPGVRYLSILPTNHAIDFMVGFFGPFTCGAAVVHLRTLRPEYVREAFPKYKITYVSVVPLVLKNLQKGLQARFNALPAGDGVGEVADRSKTVMAGYLNDPELTAEAIGNGWLMTGDLGRFASAGHLQLFGRKKNMIVTEEGKNIYPEDIEAVFESLPVKEFCLFAANYIWPRRSMVGEQLIIVIRLENGQAFSEQLKQDIILRNNRLLNYKRIHGIVLYEEDFPRTASLKIKRNELAERLAKLDRDRVILPLYSRSNL